MVLKALRAWKPGWMFTLDPCMPASLEAMAFHLENRIEVAASPLRVFELVAGVSASSDGSWFPDFRSATWRTPPPHGVGSVRDYRLSHARLIEHFIVWEPGRRVAFYVSRSSLPFVSQLVEDYQITAVPGGSELVWRVGYRVSPVFEYFSKSLRKVYVDVFGAASRRLKALLEAAPPSSRAPFIAPAPVSERVTRN
jgi:polyketide cyclase/dehydrase/lipid transport protein